MKTSTTSSVLPPRTKAAKSNKKTGLQKEADHTYGTMAEVQKISYVEEVVQHEFEGREITHHDIARMALRIYKEEGCPEGRAEAHWFEAERRLREGHHGIEMSSAIR